MKLPKLLTYITSDLYMKKLFLILAGLMFWLGTNAQTVSAGGVVLDYYTQKPMEYIPVYIKNTATGCLTNYKGEFFLKDSSGADTLVVEAIGYGKYIKKLNS